MVKVIADWERSGSGHGMINNLVDEGDENEGTLLEARVYEFIDGDNQKSFLHKQTSHILIYGILLPHLTYYVMYVNNFGMTNRSTSMSKG